MNIGSAMNLMSQGKQAWATFKQNHPEFPKFLNYVKNKGVPEGTVKWRLHQGRKLLKRALGEEAPI